MPSRVDDSRCNSCGADIPNDAPFRLCPRCLLKQALAGTAAETLPVADRADGPSGDERRRFVAPSLIELAEEFPQLEVLELIGQGGMGAVYRARQPTLDRIVAVKVLPTGVEESPGFSQRFSREARALARLNHPNIVALYDFGQTSGRIGLFYFIMEYVDGANLRDIVRRGNLEPKQALAIVPQICDALQYAHDEGVVHRDIKPENILVDSKGRVKIADFGLAKLLDASGGSDTITRDGEFMGTPLYMAPEQRETAHQVDHRADIYSLGVVFYELLTGDLPMGRFSVPSQRVNVDVRLDEVVLRALEQEPERRYQQARDVKTEVETISTTPLPPGALEPERAAARSLVSKPARALILSGLVNWLLLISVLIVIAVRRLVPGALDTVPQPLLPIIGAVALFGSGIMIFAGLKMLRLESRGLALVAAFLAAIITPGNLIGLPIGIWVWVVLHRQDVRAAFPASPNSAPWPERIGRYLRSPQNCAMLFAVLGVLTILIPWGRFQTFWMVWGYGWRCSEGIAVASISAALLIVTALGRHARPPPVSRSLLLVAGGIAMVSISAYFVEAFLEVARSEAAAYDPDFSFEKDDASNENGAAQAGEAFSRQMNAIIARSAVVHVGPFAAIAAGVGLVGSGIVELSRRARDRRQATAKTSRREES